MRWESSDRVDMSQKGAEGAVRRSARQSGKEPAKAGADAQDAEQLKHPSPLSVTGQSSVAVQF